MEEVVNLCPHPINIGDREIPVSELGPLRLREVSTKDKLNGRIIIDGKATTIPIYPPAKYNGLYFEKNPSMDVKVLDGQVIIVSQVVGDFWADKTHHGALPYLPKCVVLVPNTSPGHVKRTDKGQVGAVDSLRVYAVSNNMDIFHHPEGYLVQIYEFMA